MLCNSVNPPNYHSALEHSRNLYNQSQARNENLRSKLLTVAEREVLVEKQRVAEEAIANNEARIKIYDREIVVQKEEIKNESSYYGIPSLLRSCTKKIICVGVVTFSVIGVVGAGVGTGIGVNLITEDYRISVASGFGASLLTAISLCVGRALCRRERAAT